MEFILAGTGNSPADWKLIDVAASESEILGFWGFVMPDHYMGGRNFGGDSTLDTWLALTHIAPRTETIRLGTLVTPITLRPPSILAKMVSTLDNLSGGRAILGVGAGSSQTEFDGYSQWSSSRLRVEKTDEAVRLILKLWTEDKVDFQGKYYRSKGAILEPKPQQKPGPPLFFGGVGKKMLLMAGRYADICLIPPFSQFTFGEAKKLVNDEAKRHGRDKEISFAGVAGNLPLASAEYDAKHYLKMCEQAEEQGWDYMVVPFRRENYIESMEDFATNILPSFR
ncbi:MAG TPA: LLM class flavin-dependent oxidoreductase [Candidatus Bathyarchaeia archaeon]|nr:LLM class flavin-dependent oxidoreductase [Candidatus Bathyarchaeia archaeon]